MHALIHILDAPKVDENEDSELGEFIEKYITRALPDETKYPKSSNLLKKVQTCYHVTTSRKKKGCVGKKMFLYHINKSHVK